MIKFLKEKKVFSTVVLVLLNFICFSQKINNNGAVINMYDGSYLRTGDLNNSSGSIKVYRSILQIGGVITSNGNVDVTDGTIDMNGAIPQDIPAAAFFTNKIKNVIINNDVTLQGEDSITDVLSFGSSNRTFNTGGYLTLKSTAINTARVADITNYGANSGNTVLNDVHVERFIQAHRAWRLLTAPLLTGAGTVNEAWQEGQISGNSIPGFGTHITGGTYVNGFDSGVRNSNPAIQFYNGTGWTRLPATNTGSITDYPGYIVFIRGSRAVNLSQGVNAAADNTVLRSTGQLKENTQTYSSSGPGFALAGNPYASGINFHSTIKDGLGDTYYLWDPLLAGTNNVGGYITLTWNGFDYTAAPTPVSPIETTGRIESGAAFFVEFTSSGSLSINETDKLSGSLPVARPASRYNPQLRTNLYGKNTDNTLSLVDGIVSNYGYIYSNNIDNYDALKITNFAENLGMMRNNKILAIERRQEITADDTIFLNMTQMKVKNYQFDFIADDLYSPGLTATLIDNYTKTSTPVSLQDITHFSFDVKNIPGSYASNRFMIVFKAASPLPVFVVNLNAYRKNPDIAINWKVENELNIKQYEVEHSLNGTSFTSIKTTLPLQNNGDNGSYTAVDPNASAEDNFYRIKSTDLDGKIRYSSIVKVSSIQSAGEIMIYANTITNGNINLQFTNMPGGKYGVRVMNNLGEIILTKEIIREKGSSSEILHLANYSSKGLYNIEVIRPDKNIDNLKILN